MSAKWTVMVYMAGNNSLSGAASQDLKELRKTGSTPDVRALAFVKQRDTASALHIEIAKDGANEHTEQLGNADSGDPQTVIKFIRWAVATAPADRYALVLWNHGGGWSPDDMDQLYSQIHADTGVNRHELNRRSTQNMARSVFSTTVKRILAQPSEGERQICNDDGTGHSLDTIELGNLLKAATQQLGRPLDVLGMDACLMSTLEVAYQARDDVRVVVGSEELEPGAGWLYSDVLAKLGANPGMDAAAFGRLAVQSYVASYKAQPSQWPITQAALDTGRLPAFAAAVDALVDALLKLPANRWQHVTAAWTQSIHFESEMIDLQTFCRGLAAAPLAKRMKNAANAVIAALTPGGVVLDEGHLGPKVEGCGGVTVYMPARWVGISKYYADLTFAKDHRWDEFLAKFHQAA